MYDLALTFFRKLVEVALILIVAAGLYNFFRTPGGLPDKLIGAYEKTAKQGSQVLRAGQDTFSKKEGDLARDLGSGILEIKKKRERGLETDTQW